MLEHASAAAPLQTLHTVSGGGLDTRARGWIHTQMFKVNNPLWDSSRPKKKKKKRSKECRSMFGMKADVIDVKRMTGGALFGGVPLWRCGGDRNRPLLSPGSRSHPSAWSHVCLRVGGRRGGGGNKAFVCLEHSKISTAADFSWRVRSTSCRIMTGRTRDGAVKKKKKEKRRGKKKNQTLIMTNLWFVCDDGWKKTSAALFLCFFFKTDGGSHCIFTLDCILTLLWYIIAVCFISRCRTAVRNRWGTQHPSSTSRHKHSTSQLKSSR